MKKTDELRQKMTAKKLEVTNFQKDNKFEDAVKAAEELKILNQQFQIEKALEEATFENFMKHKEQVTPTATDAATLRKRAFNKLVLNPLRGEFATPLTDEERNAYFNSGEPGQPGQVAAIPAKGGYLVPEEQMKTLQEIRKGFVALKDYVKVVTTNAPSGRWPVYKRQKLKFRTVAELQAIPKSDLTFEEKTFVVEDRFLNIPISNILIEDSDIDIVSFSSREINYGVIATENERILEPLQRLITGDTATGIAEAQTITSYKSLNTALFKTLDSIYMPNTNIFTNQDGFLWLSNLDDGQGRPLIQPNIQDANQYFYRGKKIITVPNDDLPNVTVSGKQYAPILIGDLYNYLTYFERKGLQLSTSTEALFDVNGLSMRGIIRFGIVVTDSDAMTALKVEI